MQNAMKWISVKNKLPDKPGEYLVTTEAMGPKRVEIVYYGEIDLTLSKTMNAFHYNALKYSKSKYHWHKYDSEIGDIPIYDVIAWMPLPEPY